jgi:protein-S-isoprenylcysteine O-methyltransferase Ste14
MLTTTARPLSSAWLAVRSLFWTMALPGLVAGYIPWRYLGLDRAPASIGPLQVLGLVLIALGLALLAACIIEFARQGRGTLSPVDPPRRLVVRGLYQYVRNPMYLSVTTIVLGEALWMSSWRLAAYWLVWFACANFFVIGYEEPDLQERFGQSYDEYIRRVPRWVPRWRV